MSPSHIPQNKKSLNPFPMDSDFYNLRTQYT